MYFPVLPSFVSLVGDFAVVKGEASSCPFVKTFQCGLKFDKKNSLHEDRRIFLSEF